MLGEIGRPRRTMPVGTSIGVGIVCVLYLLVNVAYVSMRSTPCEYMAF